MTSSFGESQSAPAWLRSVLRFERYVLRGEQVLCGLALLIMALATVTAVVIRNLGLMLPNYGEVGLAMLAPLTLLGAAMCLATGAHITIELVQVLPSRLLRLAAEVITLIAVVTFAVFYFRSGLILTEEFLHTGDKLLDLNIPLWPLAALFPVGMGLMIFHTVVRALQLTVSLRQSGEAL